MAEAAAYNQESRLPTERDRPNRMQSNPTFYRIGLSLAGGTILGVLGLIVGAVWAEGVGADVLNVALVAGTIAALWGMTAVHLTPTGGTITENRTTVNYAVFALHGWYAFFLCIAALTVWALRSWAF
jgi:hypothetical protein